MFFILQYVMIHDDPFKRRQLLVSSAVKCKALSTPSGLTLGSRSLTVSSIALFVSQDLYVLFRCLTSISSMIIA